MKLALFLIFFLLTGCKTLSYPDIPLIEVNLKRAKCYERRLVDSKLVTFSSVTAEHALYLYDESGAFVGVNPLCETTFGYRAADFKKAQNFARDAQAE